MALRHDEDDDDDDDDDHHEERISIDASTTDIESQI